MWGPKYSSMKLKMNLKLAITRLKMLEKKHDNASVLARKEVASLLDSNRVELAKIKVEQIIRDDFYREALEILETYCSLALARFGLIESVQYCDPGIRKAVCTIIWATPRVSVDVVEFKEISKQLSLRYGKEFAEAARTNSTKEVCQRVTQKLSFVMPDTGLVVGYLEAIAAKYSVDWKPTPETFDSLDGTGPQGGGGGGGGGGGDMAEQAEQGGGEKPVDLMTPDMDALSLNFPQPPGADQPPQSKQQPSSSQAAYAFPPPLSTSPQPAYPPAPQQHNTRSLAYPPPPPQQQQQPSYPPTAATTHPTQPQQHQHPQQPQHSLMDFPDVPDSQPPSYGQASAPQQNNDTAASLDPFVNAFPSVPPSTSPQPPAQDGSSLHLPDPPSSSNRSSDTPLDYDSLTRRFNALQKK